MAGRHADLSQANEASQVSPHAPTGQLALPKTERLPRIQQAFLQVWKPNKSDSRHHRAVVVA